MDNQCNICKVGRDLAEGSDSYCTQQGGVTLKEVLQSSSRFTFNILITENCIKYLLKFSIDLML